MLKTLSGFIVLGCLLGPTVASADGQDQSIAQLGDRLTKVAGHDGLLAWSEWDAESERYGDKPFDVAVACDAESDPISIIGGSWAGSQLVYARERIEGDRPGDLIARSSDGQRRTLGTYTVKGFLAYIAVGDDAIVGTLSERPDRVRIDRLSPLP
jgi:hypothetical protein